MSSELPHPLSTSISPEQLDAHFVRITHTGNQNPMWHFGIALPKEMNQLVSDRAEPPARDGETVSLACFDREDHVANIEVYAAWVDREIDSADALDALIAAQGLNVVSYRRTRTPHGVIGDAVVEWVYEGQPFAGRFFATKRGPRLFILWARTPRENYAALADTLLVSIGSFTIVEERPGPLAEVVSLVEGRRPLPWKAMVPKSWRVSAVAAGPKSASFPALLSSGDEPLARLLFVITAPTEATDASDAATRHLGSLLPAGVGGDAAEWIEEDPVAPFEKTWLLVQTGNQDGRAVELRVRVARHAGAWVAAGIIGPAREANLGLWMSCKRLLDLVTFELEIHGVRTGAAPVVERPPITSRAEFLRQLTDAQPVADRLAGEHPEMWQFNTLSQLLSSMEQMTEERDPEAQERQSIAPMLDAIRQQSADPSPELADLLSWFSTIAEFFVNWPQTSAVDESADDDTADASDVEIEPLQSFEDLVQTVREGSEEVETLRDVLQERMNERRHANSARRAIQALGDVGSKLYDILRALADWVRGEAPMSESRRGELLIGRRAAKHLRDGPTAGLSGKIRQIDAFLKGWSAAEFPASGTVARFEDLVLSLHRVLATTETLLDRFKEHKLPDRIHDRVERTIRRLGEWVSEGNVPSPEERGEVALWPVVEAYHALHTLPELVPLIERIRTLGLVIEDWPAPFRDSFLNDLYETDIDAKLLVLRTGDESFTEVERRLQLAVYSAADGRIDTDYGRSQIALAEAYENYLAMYLTAPQSGLLEAARQIDAFLVRWQPVPIPDMNLSPMEQALERPAVSSRVMQGGDEYREDEDEDEEAEEPAVGGGAFSFEPTDWYDDDGAATARSLDHNYWLHLLESAIKSFSTDRSWLAHRRQIGMALRAIRRWTRNGQPAPDADRRAVAWLFRSLAFDADHVPAGVSYPRDMIEVQSLHAYFQLWPNPKDALEKAAEKGFVEPGGVIRTADEFAEIVDETLADAECLVTTTNPPLPQNVALVRAMRRIEQSVAYGRSLRPEDKAEIDRVLAAVEPPPEQFPFVPDFAEDFISRSRRLNDYFQGRRVNSTSAFFELLHAAHADIEAAVRGRVWDDDKEPMNALERQLRALKRWTAGGRSPTEAERAGTRDILRRAASLKGADTMAEFVHRCGELADALDVVFPEAGNARVPAPPPIDGRESLEAAIAAAMLDTQGLSARPMFAKPNPLQQFWVDVKNRLDQLVKLLDPSRARTQRERDEITTLLAGELRFDGDPFSAVPDFRENLTTRLRGIARAFNDLMAAEPYASKEAKALSTGGIDLITFGRSVMMHFARLTGAGAGIYTCRFDRKYRDLKVGELDIGISEFVPTDREMVQLVASDGWTPTGLRISPHNDFIAYITTGPRGNEVGWCSATEAGELGRVPGAALTWTTKGQTLIVLDPPSGTVWRIDAGKQEKREIVKLPSPAALTPAPRLVVSPDGERVAVSYVPAGSAVSELLVIEYQGRSATTRSIGKESSDAGPTSPIELLPFWAKDGTQLAYLAMDKVRRSSWICAYQPYKAAPPERLYSADRLDIAQPPSWSPTGRWISFLRAAPDGQPELALLDCDRREVLTLEGIGPLSGRPDFGEESVLLHGGTIGMSLWFRNLTHKREEPERF